MDKFHESLMAIRVIQSKLSVYHPFAATADESDFQLVRHRFISFPSRSLVAFVGLYHFRIRFSTLRE